MDGGNLLSLNARWDGVPTTKGFSLRGKGERKGTGKNKGKGKSKGKTLRRAPMWGLASNIRNSPLAFGDVISLRRFHDVPSLGVGPLIIRSLGGSRIRFEKSAPAGGILRIRNNGSVDFGGRPQGPFTIFRVAFSDSSEVGSQNQEISLFGERSGLWLTIEEDGTTFGSSVTRRALECHWLEKDAQSPEAEKLQESSGLRQRRATEPTDIAQQHELQQLMDQDHEKLEEEEDVEDASEEIGELLEPLAFWTKELKDLPVFELNFPPLHPMDGYLTHEVGISQARLDGLGRLKPSRVLAAWVAVLCRYSRSESVAVAVADLDDAGTGSFPLRIAGFAEWSVEKLSKAAHARFHDAKRCKAEFLSSLEGAGLKAESVRSICQVGFSYGAAAMLQGPALSRPGQFMEIDWGSLRGNLMLQLRCAPGPEDSADLQLLHEYGCMSAETASRLLKHIHMVLAADESIPCAALEICCPHERSLLMQWSDKTSVMYEQCAKQCVHHSFHQLANDFPSRTALVEEERAMTYSQLASAAVHISNALVVRGVEVDDLVPLMSKRSLEMIVGIYGILFAGAGYVPIDTKWPDDRVTDVVSQCWPVRAVCAGPGFADRLQGIIEKVAESSDNCVVELDAHRSAASGGQVAAPSVVLPRSKAGGQGAVYCYFTSGSSGKPKGVVVEHRGLVHRIKWFQERWGMHEGECQILKHSYTFGLSEWEIFWPLSIGGTLVLCKHDGEKDMEYLWHLLDRHRVRTQVFVPSVLRALLEFAELEVQNEVDAQGRLWPHLCHAITCGEALTADLAQRFIDVVPHASLDNLYGPTEGEMTVWRCPKGEILPSIPIGVPMDGSRIIMCTSAGGLAGIGEPGEINFGGQFIARGYLGLPSLTAEKFFLDEHEGSQHGARLYMSGDLARWRETGLLDFLGRIDFQVKIRGFRIELGEIEEALRSAGIRMAVCVVCGESSQQRLVAYVLAPAGGTDPAALRAACAACLPQYMVPSQIVVLESMPRTASGKIDRKALPAPPEPSGLDCAEAEITVIGPRDPLEKKIRSVWAAVLGRAEQTVSVEADWPLIGGNSLLAGKATSLLRKELGVQVPGTAMYTHSTVAKLAQLMAKMGVSLTASTEARETLAAEVSAADGEHRYKGNSSLHPVALIAQLLVAVVGNMIGDTASWALRCALGWYVYVYAGRSVLLILMPWLLGFFVALEAFACIVLKRFVVGRLLPGKYPLWGRVYFRWLFSRHLVEKVRDRVSEFISGTYLLVMFYRALGAKIGERVNLNDPELEEPDLVDVGNDVEINHARISTSGIVDGELMLGEVKIGSRCRVMPRAMVVMGTTLADGTEISPMATTTGWMGSVGAVCPPQLSEISRVCTQDMFRLCIGLPWLLFLHALPMGAVIYLLEALWRLSQGTTWHLPFWILAPLIVRHGYALGFFTCVVLQKRLVVGRLLPGPQPEEGSKAWHWEAFRTWLHEQAICARAFDEALDPFVGSEMLCVMYRLLGAKVGRHVQMDNVHIAEHDCLEIADDVVFGSVVSIHCEGQNGRQPVKLLRGSNVLDHGVLMAGAVIGERAVLGSASLAPENSYFPPESISTGQVGGKPVRLRFQVSTGEQLAVEWEAMRRLNSNQIFWSFNSGLIFAAVVCSPVPIYQVVLTSKILGAVWSSWGLLAALAAVPVAYSCVTLAILAMNCLLKWWMIGQYQEGDYTFFSSYHIRWTIMMILSGVMEDALDALQGTEFLACYYRAMGAKVGCNCCLFGLAFEYDLLSIGDCCSIGWECDTTCHTVENMVIKLAPTVLEHYASMMPHSMVSPGAVLSEGAVVLENSQVLKGELVPANECWAGLPASSCGSYGEVGSSTVSMEGMALGMPLEQGEAESDLTGPGPKPAHDVNQARSGLEALREGAVIAVSQHRFLVEHLWNGNFAFAAFGDENNMEPRIIRGHLRIRRSGHVDFNGRRGKLAQFKASAGSEDGVVLQNVGTGLFLSVDDGRLISNCTESRLDVTLEKLPGAIVLPKAMRNFRRSQEFRMLMHEARQRASYALQSSHYTHYEKVD